MPSQTTATLDLPLIADGQASKHVTHNEALDQLDLLVQCSVRSRTETTEPSAHDGDLYILPPGKTGGSWSAMADGALAGLVAGAWLEFAPRTGWTAFVEDDGEAVVFEAGGWRVLASDRVARAGDDMTGPLSLPVNGLQVGDDQLKTSAGRVGVHHDMPGAPLHIGRSQRDMVWLGPRYGDSDPDREGDIRLSIGAWEGRPEIYMTRHDINGCCLTIDASGQLAVELGGAARVLVDNSGHMKPAVANTYACGTSSYPWSAVYAQSGVITTSDAREKADMIDSPLGLGFILALRPRGFRYVQAGMVESPATNPEETPVFTPRAGQRLHTGFIAQEVHDALPPDVDWAGWILADPSDSASRQSLRYEALIAPLVAAVQTLAQRVTALEAGSA